ncbi:MAG: hypothetical protein IPO63_04800 [Bacteroidetes bacterium]|nr:hypothetical protein [Bacteroidota bacterium]
MDDSNYYCVPVTKLFIIGGDIVTGYEYWFDEDYFSKSTINVSGASLIEESLVVSVAGLSQGFHKIHLRAFNGNLLSSSVVYTSNICKQWRTNYKSRILVR